MVGVNTVLTSRTVGILRLGTLVALVGVAAALAAPGHLPRQRRCGQAGRLQLALLTLTTADGRQDHRELEGFSFPSPPVAALAVTLVGMVYALLPAQPRSWGKWATGATLLLLGFARTYLAVDHPTDLLSAVILGVGIPVVAFRFFTPNEVYPVTTGEPRPRTWTWVGAAGRRSAPPSKSSWA